MSGLDILPNITDVRFKDIWGRGARSAVRQGGRPDQTRRLQTGPDWSIDLPPRCQTGGGWQEGLAPGCWTGRLSHNLITY